MICPHWVLNHNVSNNEKLNYVRGVRRQVRAYRSGFSEVFSVKVLRKGKTDSQILSTTSVVSTSK
jgi:hypothetical protein